MAKSKKNYYTIKEVAEMLGVSTSTLRFWEDEFEVLSPGRPGIGYQRRYTLKDIEIAKAIKELIHTNGIKINNAKEIMLTYRKNPPRYDFVCKSTSDALNLLREAAKMIYDQHPHAEARLKAITQWLSQTQNEEN